MSKTKKKLSSSLEDYIEAIAELTASKGHAHTKDIAECLRVKMPSVTGRLQKLEALGLIVYNSHQPVILTEPGRKIAAKIMRRHQILTDFFMNILCLPIDKAKKAACEIEHHVDEDIIERILIFSNGIGTRQDGASLRTWLSEALDNLTKKNPQQYLTLSELSTGESALVDRLSGNLAGESVLRPGMTVSVLKRTLDSRTMHLKVEDQEIALPSSSAEQVWMRKTS
jgi:DtxR family Mn-dependent transcriptional regulator